jgi:hypothetical protein
MTMIATYHNEYLTHLSTQIIHHSDDPIFWEHVGTYAKELSILSELSLDSVREALTALYCPTGNGDPKDPCAMLRSWLLMTLCRESSPTVWATRLRRESALAILAGFGPGHTPCATTHINFLTRLLDGPYAFRKKQDATLSQQLKGRHRHRLEDATKQRAAEADAAGKTQSALLADTLLQQAEQPRNPHELQTRLDHLFVELGLKVTLNTGLLNQQDLTVAGDGTAEPSAASKNGHRACQCPKGSKCQCPRDYLSKTAQFCYDKQHGWIFGDRSYTISVNSNGRDLPLMTIMGTGNESDFTLSLKAIDRLLKMIEELDLAIGITIFIGDGHHDAIGIYRYLKAKGIVPVIPLDENSQPKHQETTSKKHHTSSKTPTTPANTLSTGPSPIATAKGPNNKKKLSPRPQIEMYPSITFENDGTPLCPGGCRMRHQHYNASKQAHIFACPCTRKNSTQQWVFHTKECPLHQDCTPPEKKMGHTLYIKSEADLRLFPPIPRDSTRFKKLATQRTSSERQNAVADSYRIDRCQRNAAYTLIRLTFVNICKHAVIRDAEKAEKGKKRSTQAQLHDALTRLNLSEMLPN